MKWYLSAALAFLFLVGNVFAGTVTVTVTEDGKKPRTVSVDLPPAENVDPPPPVNQPTVPTSPTDLKAQQVGTEAKVHLWWTDNSTDESGFWIERDAGTGFVRIDDVAADVREADDVGVEAGKQYAYRVTAVKEGVGTSSYTTAVQVQVLPPPPPPISETQTYTIPATHVAFNGSDLSNLDGNYRLKPGTYTVNSNSLKTGVDLRATTAGTVIIKGSSGKQIKFGKNVNLYGVTFDGGGLAKDTDGTHAAVVTDDGAFLHTVRVTKAVGVGILMKGTGLNSWYLEADHNGTSGRMIRSRGVNQKPGSGYTEMYPHLHHNNIGGKKSDAANKATQTSEYYSKGLHIHDDDDGGQWFDIACWNCVLEEPYIHDIKSSAEWYRAVGVRFELNSYGTYASGIYRGRFDRLEGSALAVNESSNIEMTDSVIGKCHGWLELRQQTRSDDPGDGGTNGPWPRGSSGKQGPGRPDAPSGWKGWVTYNINLSRNHVLAGAGPADYSGSNGTIKPQTKDIKQGAFKIVFKDNVFDSGNEASMIKIAK
jgi:hypothetical protein